MLKAFSLGRGGHICDDCTSLSPGVVGTLVTARSIHFTRRSNVSMGTLSETVIGHNVLVRGDTNKNDALSRRLTGRLFARGITDGALRHLLRGPVR